MPFYYGTGSQQNTNATANTDTLLADLSSVAASHRAYLQKLQCGVYATPADNQMRLRIQRLATVGTYARGTAITPNPSVPDAPAANVTGSTLPALGTGTLNAVPLANLAFNQRGTGLWAAFTPDEAFGMVGAVLTVNALLILNSQSTGTSVPVNFELAHSE